MTIPSGMMLKAVWAALCGERHVASPPTNPVTKPAPPHHTMAACHLLADEIDIIDRVRVITIEQERECHTRARYAANQDAHQSFAQRYCMSRAPLLN